MWWVELNHAYMDSCDELWVLMMYDNYGSWKDSSGIKDEIAYAKELGLKIKFIECV
jgi:GH18 family chitinase